MKALLQSLPRFAGVCMCAAVICGSNALADELPVQLRACRAIADGAERVACYDRVVADLPPAAAAPSISMTPEQKFGLQPAAVEAAQVARGEAPKEVAEISPRVVSMSLGPSGRVVLGLDNAQVWQQLVPGPDLLLKLGDTIKLTRGAFGSFWLEAPSGRACKVTRLR